MDELARLLAATDRRPILLVGPRKVGKTAIVHELVRQICARKKERHAGGHEIWLVSPMRLISGMSYLGEWENRVLAILDHARSKDHVLFFDDLPGLFSAGTSSASSLNVAQVLKPTLEKRAVRVLGEITPEAWRVLCERDRAFADLFHVIPVNEPPEPETLRVLVNVARQQEEEHRCTFDLEVVPTVYELHRRFAGDAAFPGKAAGFLRRVAMRSADKTVTRECALHEFQEISGLQTALLDDRATLERKGIVEQLRRWLVGQDHVLDAFADVLVTLKARLNDPKRPLGTLLLLGPTGVGKTQSAKALAEFLFGSPARLLRFDMNEYVDAASARRLTGTPREPEGLLTGAIRRQPFGVVLFDEIEKAAPGVFDLLLAVLDEGRLTDALGRVAHFTQSVILMTSNLGVREARSRLGFGAATTTMDADDTIYVSAAEKFFRPEFFNRLDRIVPFRPLAPAQLEGIARQLLNGIFARDGLKRRDGLLNVTPDAMRQLVQLGYHPQLGARALKRVIEQKVAQPIAERLAALPPGTPTITQLEAQGDQFSLQVRELAPQPRSVFWPEALIEQQASGRSVWIASVLNAVYAALDRIEAELETVAPEGKIELAALPPEHAHYFCCREQLRKVDRLAQATERMLTTRPKPPGLGRLPKAKPVKVRVRQHVSGNPQLGRLRSAVALQLDLADLAAESVDVPDSPMAALLRELALLEVLAAKPVDDRPGLLVFRAYLEADGFAMHELARLYARCLGYLWGVIASGMDSLKKEDFLLAAISGKPQARIQAAFLQGLNLRRILPLPAQTILTRRQDGGLGVVLLTLIDAASELEARATVQHMADTIETLDPAAFGPVVQLIKEKKTLTDFRTGLAIPASASPEEFRAFFLSTLPLPPEVDATIQSNAGLAMS